MPKVKDKGIKRKPEPEPSTADITVIDITESTIDITDSPIRIKKIKVWDESQNIFSARDQSGSQHMFPSEDMFPTPELARFSPLKSMKITESTIDITDSPIRVKKIKIWDAYQNVFGARDQSGSQHMFPSDLTQDLAPDSPLKFMKIRQSIIDIIVSPIRNPKIKVCDESPNIFSHRDQSGSQDLFDPSEDMFASQDILSARGKSGSQDLVPSEDIDESPVVLESEDSYSGGGPSGSQIFPTQVVLESQDITEDGSEKEGSNNSITTEEPVVTENDPYAYSNFKELHDVMVNVFKRICKKPLETHSDASRKFLKFCDAVVRIRNVELQEMIENGEIFQRNEESSPKE